ncbi:MAG: hypothetical protein ACJ8CO_16980, partial [Microvirga sp.]
AKFGGHQGEAMRDAIRTLHLKPDQLLLPWENLSFDPETHQNRGAGIAVLGIQDGRVMTIWPPQRTL